MEKYYFNRLLLLSIFIIANCLVRINGQTKPIINQIKAKTTLDSLQGIWVLKIDTTQKIKFYKDTMVMFDHNILGSKNRFYLSQDIVREYDVLLNQSDKNNGHLLTAVDPEIQAMFTYGIVYLSSKKLILGYAHKGGPYEYFRAKGNSKNSLLNL